MLPLLCEVYTICQSLFSLLISQNPHPVLVCTWNTLACFKCECFPPKTIKFTWMLLAWNRIHFFSLKIISVFHCKHWFQAVNEQCSSRQCGIGKNIPVLHSLSEVTKKVTLCLHTGLVGKLVWKYAWCTHVVCLEAHNWNRWEDRPASCCKAHRSTLSALITVRQLRWCTAESYA